MHLLIYLKFENSELLALGTKYKQNKINNTNHIYNYRLDAVEVIPVCMPEIE